MISIPDILQPGHVNLTLAARDKDAAIQEVLAKLNGDDRIKNFEVFKEAVHTRNAAAIEESGVAICLAHGRTESVTSLVMAAGRSTEGFTSREVKSPIRLVFVAGIPAAFNSEYLRVVGAIARICRERPLMDRLLAVKTAEDFIDLLGTAEIKL